MQCSPRRDICAERWNELDEIYQAAFRSARYAEAGDLMLTAIAPSAREVGAERLARIACDAFGDRPRRAHAIATIRELIAAHETVPIGAPRVPMFLMQWSVLLEDTELAFHIAGRVLAHFARHGGLMPITSFFPQIWSREMLPFRRHAGFG